MSDVQTVKIMKKLFYSVLALAGTLAVSCNKEIDKQQANVLDGESVSTHTVTIRADFDAETRTTYANDKTFSWVAGDIIYVYTVNESTGKARWAELTAESGGATADFTGEVEDGFVPQGIAFYAHSEWVTWDDDNFYVYLPGTTAIDDDTYSYNVESSNPMANVPLSGLTDSEGVFHFKTSTGVVKFNLTDVPSDAKYFELAAADGLMLQGLFAVDLETGQMDRDGAVINWTYTDSSGQEQTERVSYTNLFYKFTPDAQGKATIYVPVPVGTLGAGASIRLYNEDDEIIFTKKTVKDIPVTRNKVIELTALSCEPTWTSMGTGKYNDAEYLYDLYLEDMNVDSDQIYVDVDIWKDAADEKAYKVIKPYAAYNTMFSYTTKEDVNAPNDLSLRILRTGDDLDGVTIETDGLVYFDPIYTGFWDTYYDYNTEMYLLHPSFINSLSTEASWMHSYVMKFQSDGVTPANIQLAPMYYYDGLGCYTTDADADGVVQIVFPGFEPLDVTGSVVFDSVVDDSPEQPIASVEVKFGANIASADVVIATSLAEATAALAAGKNVVHVAAPSQDVEVPLPANAPSGKYVVYARLNGEEGLSPLVTRIITGSDFKYFNPLDDKGYTLDDILGTYSVQQYYYNGNEGDWLVETMSFVVEESDDPLSSDIMFTEFLPEVLGYFSNLVYSSPLYASFNTATGEILIPGGQTIASSGGAEWTVGGFSSKTSDVHMTLEEAGRIAIDGNVAFYATVSGADYGRFMWTNKDITFTRSSSSAPAAVPAFRGRMDHSVNRLPLSREGARKQAPQAFMQAK